MIKMMMIVTAKSSTNTSSTPRDSNVNIHLMMKTRIEDTPQDDVSWEMELEVKNKASSNKKVIVPSIQTGFRKKQAGKNNQGMEPYKKTQVGSRIIVKKTNKHQII